MRDLGQWLGISGTTLFLCRQKDAAISAKTWRKLERAEERARRPEPPWGLIPETPDDAAKEWDPLLPEPTQAEILAFVAAALARAARQPGGLGWSYQELRGIFPPGKIESPEKP